MSPTIGVHLQWLRLLLAAGGSEAAAGEFALGRKDWMEKSGLCLMAAWLWEGV